MGTRCDLLFGTHGQFTVSGAKRLVNEFDIHTEVGKGTRVMIARWK